MPDGDDVAVERSVGVAGRQVEDDRLVLGVEEHHEVERIGIRRERLVARIERPPPIDDLTDPAVGLAQHFLQHQVVVHGRHAPDHGFGRTLLEGTVGGRPVGFRGVDEADEKEEKAAEKRRKPQCTKSCTHCRPSDLGVP